MAPSDTFALQSNLKSSGLRLKIEVILNEAGAQVQLMLILCDSFWCLVGVCVGPVLPPSPPPPAG